MFNRVLVANRGEIGVRIIRALREMGITSVAIYSTADKNAMHTELADEAICIGPANGLDSYANPLSVINAAVVMNCDAIHPGYGFLSEKSDFVELCQEVGIQFIGPSSQIIERMGNKQNARETMKQAGLPTTPGSEGLVDNYEQAQKISQQLGFPLMIKASDGGGGKGMRRVDKVDQLAEMFHQVQRESQSIYGNQNIYIEKVITNARHIEVQILADHHGNVVHLGERDCSLQRNHQKIIEVAPALSLTEASRTKIAQASVEACKKLGYTNAGTIEFLVDQDENFYFMEMNTRLQVEHPITEMVTGIDIVKEQIRIASGKPLSFKQEDVVFNGFAIECRLNAEDPRKNFRPSSGRINRLIFPSGGLGLRVESGIYPDYTLPPYYDSMVAKIVAHHTDIDQTFTLMKRALVEVVVEGLETNVDLLEDLIYNPRVEALDFHTKWIELEFMPSWLKNEVSD